MKAALSLTLVLALMTPALPVTAQEQAETPTSFALPGPGSQATAGPLAHAAAREAVRLAAAGEPPSSSIETVQQGGQPVSRTFQELQQRVRRGDTVYVTDDADRTVKAKLTDISDARLRALVGGTPSEWLEGTVRDVHLERPASLGKRLLIGSSVGLASHMVVASLLGRCSESAITPGHCEARGERAISIGVPVGVITGWLVERRLKQRVLVYDSGKRQAPSVAPSRDSILMGGLIGFGIGAVLGTTVGAEACLDEPRWHCAVKGGVPIAAIGALIGWLHK